MATRQWWERARLRTDEEEAHERRVSWLELFFDLVFVVVISEVAHYLAEHVSVAGVLGYCLLFFAVWWSWISGTFYSERFEANDISYRVFMFLLMIPVAAMAVFAHGGIGETAPQFALSYASARLLIIALWVRGGWHVPIFRPVAMRYTIGFSISVVLFVASVFVPAPWRFVLWGFGLLSDFLTPLPTLALQRRLPRFSSSRLPERFGLMVIIVLGEAIVGAIRGVATQHELSLPTVVAGLLALALAFCIWWIYFDFVARRPPKSGLWTITWAYGHLPLVMSIAAIGAGVLNVLTLEREELGPSVFLLTGSAVGISFIAIGALELVLRREPDEPTDSRVSVLLKVAAGLVAIFLGSIGFRLGATLFLLALLPLALVQMMYDAYVWFAARDRLQAAME